MTAPTQIPGADTGHPRRYQALAVLCLSLMLMVAGTSSLNIALPSLQRGLGASPTELLWIVASYALVFGVFLLPAGALGDRFGRKGCLQLGLAIFGVGSLLAGLSDSPIQLIGMRSLTGLGAALVMPATLSIITTIFPPHERTKAIGIWAGFAGVGGIIGPIMSGSVLEIWEWHAVFFATLPIVVLTMVGTHLLVPTSRDASATRFDPVGALFSVLCLFALLFAIIEGPDRGWTSWAVLTGFVVAAVMLVVFVWWELRVANPMLDPRFFRNQRFTRGSLSVGVTFFAAFGMHFLLTQYFQFVQGHSPLGASARALPFAALIMLTAPRAHSVAARLGRARTVAIGLTLTAAAMLVFSRLEPDSAYLWVALALAMVGLGNGISMPPSTATIVTSLPRDKAGVGSAVNDVTREVGGALGIAVLGSTVTALYRADMQTATLEVTGSARRLVEDSIGAASTAADQGQISASAFDAARDAFTSATGIAFLIAAVVVLVGAYVNLRRERTSEVPGAVPGPAVPSIAADAGGAVPS